MNKCQNCDKETKNPKFCSRSCSVVYNNKQNPKRQRTKKCKYCDSFITYDKTFCSQKCYKLGRTKRKITKAVGYERIKNFRLRLKQQSVEYKGGKCIICNYNKCIKALEFHHLDPSIKDFNCSSVSKSFESIKSELDKCVLLCSICHREVHAGIIKL